MESIAGTIKKDNNYLDAIKDAIKKKADHPRHHGIQMQAHHIISATGAKKSGVGHLLVKGGYNINHLKNLSFIPSTLKGACHLGIQPHRGNHSFGTQDSYTDDIEPFDYHNSVAQELQRVIEKVGSDCPGGHKGKNDELIRMLNALSLNILREIQFKPSEQPLSRIAKHFKKGGVGCGGVDSIGKHNALMPCPAGRDHYISEEQASNMTGDFENIRYSKTQVFRLTVGN